MRYALLIVFEYKPPPRRRLAYPEHLPAMIEDLKKSWYLANVKFQIPREDITVITDVIPSQRETYPWGIMRCDNCNPNVVHLDYPYVDSVISEIERFVDNTVRGFNETVTKGGYQDEVFIYISCHGIRIPNMETHEGDCCLTLVTKELQSCYLRNVEIFNLLFGNVRLDDECHITVPISRKVLSTEGGRTQIQYVEENVTIPSGFCGAETIEGLPPGVKMLVVIDACNSGSITNFPFRYDPLLSQMIPLREEVDLVKPYCICFSSSESGRESLGSRQGSIFTNHLMNIFKSIDKPLITPQLYETMMENVSHMIRDRNPTITGTHPHIDEELPFLGRDYSPPPHTRCSCYRCNESNTVCACSSVLSGREEI